MRTRHGYERVEVRPSGGEGNDGRSRHADVEAEGAQAVTVWLVFKWNHDGTPPDFQGAFTSEAKAVAACRTADYCVAPATLDEALPEGTTDWPGLYYPLGKP